jgi:hypothetical protein
VTPRAGGRARARRAGRRTARAGSTGDDRRLYERDRRAAGEGSDVVGPGDAVDAARGAAAPSEECARETLVRFARSGDGVVDRRGRRMSAVAGGGAARVHLRPLQDRGRARPVHRAELRRGTRGRIPDDAGPGVRDVPAGGGDVRGWRDDRAGLPDMRRTSDDDGGCAGAMMRGDRCTARAGVPVIRRRVEIPEQLVRIP